MTMDKSHKGSSHPTQRSTLTTQQSGRSVRPQAELLAQPSVYFWEPVRDAKSVHDNGEIVAEWKRELRAEIERMFATTQSTSYATGEYTITKSDIDRLASVYATVTVAPTQVGTVPSNPTPAHGRGAWVPGPAVPAYTHTWRVGDTLTHVSTQSKSTVTKVDSVMAIVVDSRGICYSVTVKDLYDRINNGTCTLGWRVGDRFRRSNSIEYTIVTASETGYFECLQGASTSTSMFDEMHLSHATRLAPAPVVAPAHFPSGRFTLQRDNSEWLILVVSGIELETECANPGATAYPVGHKKTFDANWAKSMSTNAPAKSTSHKWQVGDKFTDKLGMSYEIDSLYATGAVVKWGSGVQSVSFAVLDRDLASGRLTLSAPSPVHSWKVGDTFRGTKSGDTYTVTLVDSGAAMVHANDSYGLRNVWNERVLSKDLASGIYALIVSSTAGPKHGDIYRSKSTATVWQVDGEEMECLVPNQSGAIARHARMSSHHFNFPDYDLQKPRDWKVGDRVQWKGEAAPLVISSVTAEWVTYAPGLRNDRHWYLERGIVLGDATLPGAQIHTQSSVPLTCTGCLQTFPYAEPNQADGTLRCWSCRNSG